MALFFGNEHLFNDYSGNSNIPLQCPGCQNQFRFPRYKFGNEFFYAFPWEPDEIRIDQSTLNLARQCSPDKLASALMRNGILPCAGCELSKKGLCAQFIYPRTELGQNDPAIALFKDTVCTILGQLIIPVPDISVPTINIFESPLVRSSREFIPHYTATSGGIAA